MQILGLFDAAVIVKYLTYGNFSIIFHKSFSPIMNCKYVSKMYFHALFMLNQVDDSFNVNIEFFDLHQTIYIPCFLLQFPRKLFFFQFGNPKVIVHKVKGPQYINVQKLFKSGNYMRKYGTFIKLSEKDGLSLKKS